MIVGKGGSPSPTPATDTAPEDYDEVELGVKTMFSIFPVKHC